MTIVEYFSVVSFTVLVFSTGVTAGRLIAKLESYIEKDRPNSQVAVF